MAFLADNELSANLADLGGMRRGSDRQRRGRAKLIIGVVREQRQYEAAAFDQIFSRAILLESFRRD